MLTYDRRRFAIHVRYILTYTICSIGDTCTNCSSPPLPLPCHLRRACLHDSTVSVAEVSSDLTSPVVEEE